ncbi:MAG: carbohydrate ABC transporter permease [Clostridia bacterium]|nr:carbohydrate ABC transporter permease [Clostridia bacterium]
MSQSTVKFKKRYKQVNRSLMGNVTTLLFLAFLGVFMVLPLVFVISNAFKPLDELFIFPPRFFVRNPTLSNFSDMLIVMSESWVPFSRYLFNTIFITVLGTFGHVFFSSMAAFALARHHFPGARVIFRIIVLSLMFTPAVTAIPTYIIMAKINLLDTYWAIILPAMQTSLGLYLMKQFMETLPEAVLESARMDGAGEIRIFWKIGMPMVKPAWITLIILMIQNLWNTISSFTYSEQLKTMPQAMSQILSGGIARTGVASAVALIMLSVPLLVFIFSQSKVIETMSTSGMKD